MVTGKAEIAQPINVANRLSTYELAFDSRLLTFEHECKYEFRVFANDRIFGHRNVFCRADSTQEKTRKRGTKLLKVDSVLVTKNEQNVLYENRIQGLMEKGCAVHIEVFPNFMLKKPERATKLMPGIYDLGVKRPIESPDIYKLR